MENDKYDQILKSLNSARHLSTRLARRFYEFGQGIYILITDEDREFIEELTIHPNGNFQQNDGSVENKDQFLLPKFSLTYLSFEYEFCFRLVPAGHSDLVRGEVLVRTHNPLETEEYLELSRVTFDEKGNVVDGPKVMAFGPNNITSPGYCKGFIAQLIYDHVTGKTAAGNNV
jgi:hypothetical protein